MVSTNDLFCDSWCSSHGVLLASSYLFVKEMVETIMKIGQKAFL